MMVPPRAVEYIRYIGYVALAVSILCFILGPTPVGIRRRDIIAEAIGMYWKTFVLYVFSLLVVLICS